jgi:hypothetical protein
MKKILVCALVAISIASCRNSKEAMKVDEKKVDPSFRTLLESDVFSLEEFNAEKGAQLFLSNKLLIERSNQGFDSVFTDYEGKVNYVYNTPLKMSFDSLEKVVYESRSGQVLSVYSNGKEKRFTLPFQRAVDGTYFLTSGFMFNGFEYKIINDDSSSQHKAIILMFRVVLDDGKTEDAKGASIHDPSEPGGTNKSAPNQNREVKMNSRQNSNLPPKEYQAPVQQQPQPQSQPPKTRFGPR